jgi:hypothetical protein
METRFFSTGPGVVDAEMLMHREAEYFGHDPFGG